jgi:nickel-dependent lactate racemase
MPVSNRQTNTLIVGRVVGSATGVGVATRLAVNVADSRAKLIIRRVKVKHVSGGASHFDVTIYKAQAALAESIDQEFVGDRTGSLDLFDAVTEVHTQTDADGNLWLDPGMNSGTTNAVEWEIYYELVR